MKILGHLTAAGTSRRSEVALEAKGEMFHLTDSDGHLLSQGRVASLRFHQPLGTAPRSIALPDGSLFESVDHTAVDTLNPDRNAITLHQSEAFRPRLVGVISLTLLAGFLIWRYGVALLVAAAIWLTPPDLIRVIDRQTLTLLDRIMFTPSTLDAGTRAELEADFAHLASHLTAREAHTPMRLEFRSGPMGPNAFALPGGTVVLTDDLIALSDDRDMVAGIMGHEIGHVVHRHSLQQIYRALGIATVVGFLAGETGPVIEAMLLEGNLLLQLAFSREHEFEADAFAVDITHRAGLDPEGLIRFFDHLEELGLKDPLPAWGSTHPSNADRVAEIQARISQLARP